jgi:signal transduction histidine kinase
MMAQNSRNLIQQLIIQRAELGKANFALALDYISQLIQARRAEEELRLSRQERLAELEQVRRRIAFDLHDDIGSSLTKIALLSEAARQMLSSEKSEEACQTLAAITEISNELVESMSDIVWAINPQKDRLSDLSQRMRRFASDILTARHIRLSFRTPNVDRDIALGANVRREVFLIFKEAINNMVKHSQCCEAMLDLEVESDLLSLRVSDDGNGFDPQLAKAATGMLSSQMRGGNGLASMRRRARELGGELRVETGEGQGTTLLLRLPIEHGGRLRTVAATNLSCTN